MSCQENFSQCIINLTSMVSCPFHHIRREFFKDLDMWQLFLNGWNGRSFFLDNNITPSQEIELFTDAASPEDFVAILMGSGSRDSGHKPCSSILSRVLASSGRNYFPLSLLVPFGTPIFLVNASNSGVTMILSLQSFPLVTPRCSGLWTYLRPLPFSL